MKQIARVVLAASYYEDELTATLAAAMVLNELQCNALLRPLSITLKLDLCERLLSEGNEAGINGFKKHRRRVRRQFDQRNELVHGTFGHDDKNRVTVRSYLGKAKLRGRRERWDAERISQLAHCIGHLQDQLPTLADYLAKAIPKP